MPKRFESDAERRAYNAEKSRAWRARNQDSVREIKRRYYATEAGKAQKRKEDTALIASGTRQRIEERRALRPVSTARKDARRRWAQRNTAYATAAQAARRTKTKELDAFGFWFLQEAVALSRQREEMVGGKWHVDHIVPISKGGDSRPENLQVVPAIWNRRKSNVHAERFFGA